MGGRSPVGNNKIRICYSCGNSYPDSVRFCPRDSADLEYLPQNTEDLARDFGQPWKKWLLISIISAFLVVLATNVAVERLSLIQERSGSVHSGELTVRTTPAGARVYLDGSQVGISPVRLSLPSGVHEVRAVFPGYSDGTAHIQILPSATQRLVWDLSPLPAKRIRNRTRYLVGLHLNDIAAAKKSPSEDLI